MAQDAAASGAKSDADSTVKGDQNSDAGTTGDDSPPDIERIVAARIGQRLKALNIKDLERKAGEYDQLQESQKTETQKLLDRIATMESEKANWETERQQERIRSATVRVAAKLGYADPDDAYLLLKKDDLVEGSDIEKLLIDLLKAKPYLSSSRVNGSADGGQRGPSSESKTPDMNTLLRAAAKG